jgi:hypothetical protein
MKVTTLVIVGYECLECEGEKNAKIRCDHAILFELPGELSLPVTNEVHRQPDQARVQALSLSQLDFATVGGVEVFRRISCKTVNLFADGPFR